MAQKIKNPNAKTKGTGSKPTPEKKAQIKKIPSPEKVEDAQVPEEEILEEKKPRILDDTVITEHLMIRRAVNVIYLTELSRIFCENAATFVNSFLSVFEEDQAKELAKTVNMNSVEIATYESIAVIAVPGSPVANANKALYNILRDIARKAEGCDDENIPAEVISLDQYIDQPKYLVIRESLFIYGIDAMLKTIREENPRIIVWLTNDHPVLNPVIVDFLLLHMDAWMPEVKSHDFVTEEKINEFIQNVSEMISAISSGAMTATHMNITSNPNTDLYSIIQQTGNPYYTVNQIYSFHGFAILSVSDDSLVVDSEPTVEDMLADDGMEEDDVTLMDVINEEQPEKESSKAAPKKKKPVK